MPPFGISEFEMRKYKSTLRCFLYSFGNPSHHHNNSESLNFSISDLDQPVCDANPSAKDRIDSALNR